MCKSIKDSKYLFIFAVKLTKHLGYSDVVDYVDTLSQIPISEVLSASGDTSCEIVEVYGDFAASLFCPG